MTQPDAQAQMHWRKSSRSQEHGACVELSPSFGAVAVRDSTDPDGPVLFLSGSDWRAFVNSVKAG